MKNLNTFQFLKFIFSIWGLQVFAPFFTSIGSVSHPGYLPFLCSNGKYCLAEMDGKKVGECQWDELSPVGRYIFIGKRDGIYFLVGPKKYHKLGSQYLKFGFVRNGGSADFTIKDSITGLYATYFNEPNYLSEFIFTSIPWHNHDTPYLYGPSKDGLLLYNMENEEKYYAQGEEIKLHPPFAFIKRKGLWFAHDLKLNLLFPEGRQSYLVHNDDMVMYDEPDKDIKINPLFFHMDKGLFERADSGFSLLLPYHYLGYNSARSEFLIAYLIQEDSVGNPILHYPDKRRVFADDTEWLYEFGKVYWKTDSTTGLLSYDRLSDAVIPERIDTILTLPSRQKLFIKYLNESRDSFRVYDSDLNVSGNMKGKLYDFFWDYFFLTIDGTDSLANCRMYDWKGNLIRIDIASEFRSFRTHEAGETIIRFYGDSLADVFELPENFRGMNYTFGYEVNTYNDTKLYGWNEFSSFSYDLKGKVLTTGYTKVDQPNPDHYNKYWKREAEPANRYMHFSVTQEADRYLITCTSKGILCQFETPHYYIEEIFNYSLLELTDYSQSTITIVNGEGNIIYSEQIREDVTVNSECSGIYLLVEDNSTGTNLITLYHNSGEMILEDCYLDSIAKYENIIYFRDNKDNVPSIFIGDFNLTVLGYNNCPLLADSLQSREAYLFERFGVLYSDSELDLSTPILKSPWIPRSNDYRENSNFYSDTELGRIYINTDAPNPYFADPDIIQKVSFEGRVIDCSGKVKE